MKIRKIIVHFSVVFAILLISFVGLFVYKLNPEARTAMEKVNPDISFELLIRSSFQGFFTLLINIYLFYFLIYNLLLKRKPGAKEIILAITVFIAFILLEITIPYFIQHKEIPNISRSLIANTITSSLFGGIGLIIRSLVESFKEKEKRKELERKNLESEVNLLRSQINPHFLFNTLNNIDAMIRKDPEKASDLLIKLSSQMRYMLYDSNTERIEMNHEIAFIKDYIELQKLRLKNDEAISFSLQGDFEKTLIPPMLFIPFIENAFKHCSSTEEKDSIVFNFTIDGNKLFFESRNKFDKELKLSKDKTGGIGIELAKKRLDLLYTQNYQMDIIEDEGWYITKLEIVNNGN